MLRAVYRHSIQREMLPRSARLVLQVQNLQSVYPLLKRDIPRYYAGVRMPTRAKAVINYDSNACRICDKVGLDTHGISPDVRVAHATLRKFLSYRTTTPTLAQHALYVCPCGHRLVYLRMAFPMHARNLGTKGSPLLFLFQGRGIHTSTTVCWPKFQQARLSGRLKPTPNATSDPSHSQW